MKKPLYYLDNYEKNRILEMHQTSTKKQYITENKKVLNFSSGQRIVNAVYVSQLQKICIF